MDEDSVFLILAANFYHMYLFDFTIISFRQRVPMRRRVWVIRKRRPRSEAVTPIINPRLRIFQKRKQKIQHEMRVKKSDSNPGPHDQ